MAKKNLTLIFPFLGEEHIGKDVFLVPYYLGKKNNLSVSIVSSPNENLKNKINGVEIIQIPFKKKHMHQFYISANILKYLFYNSRKIDILMKFHLDIYGLILMFIYKKINTKGVSYIKADGGNFLLQLETLSPIKKILYLFFLKEVDIISIETKKLYDKLKLKYPQYSKKLLYIPNGFDENLLEKSNIQLKKISEKENIIITVGRLGSFQKNTELLLGVAKNINWMDWKLILIGPIEKKEQDFQEKINQFFLENPNLEDKIIFKDPIYNKKELWEYYNRAKVFVLTSRFEGFALVYTEAYRFSNFIITTNVGGAADILHNNYGIIIENESDLSQNIQRIISNDIDLQKKYNEKLDVDLSWNNILSELSDKIKTISGLHNNNL